MPRTIQFSGSWGLILSDLGTWTLTVYKSWSKLLMCPFRTTHPQDVTTTGSKYPIFEDSGPKNHTLDGFSDQSPLGHQGVE